MSRDRLLAVYTAEIMELYADDVMYLAHLRAVPWVRNGGLSAQPSAYLLGMLAMRMLDGMLSGTASKDSDAMRAACRAVGIKHTYKAIKEFCAQP